MTPTLKLLHFFCAHDATPVQIALAQSLGFYGIATHAVVFGEDPLSQITQFTKDTTVAIVAPTTTLLTLLRQGYSIIEFENMSSRRRYFLCAGAWKHTLGESIFLPSPISLGEQQEVLIRERKRRSG